ncbi:MAG: putative membrane protein YedE/YeeE [Candidatus Azotimanducaceae bacterium]|jgi:uncharacterized membrane protein YedE/YeeE
MPDHFVTAMLGGICLGLASVLMMLALGRIAGISGIAWQAIRSPVSNAWAIVFVIGLVIGADLYHSIFGQAIPSFDTPLPLLMAGGFIVGFGTKLGSGCTNGHGICGIGRLSIRSVVATATFMTFGFITVYVTRHVINTGDTQ